MDVINYPWDPCDTAASWGFLIMLCGFQGGDEVI